MHNEKTAGLTGLLEIECIESTEARVVMQMPITPAVLQPFGFLHGGATIALLESAASIGAGNSTDFARERPFGTEVCVRHRKSGRQGMVRGVAELVRTEKRKQIWQVSAFDDAGDVLSEGTVTTRIVSLEHLAEKERERTGD